MDIEFRTFDDFDRAVMASIDPAISRARPWQVARYVAPEARLVGSRETVELSAGERDAIGMAYLENAAGGENPDLAYDLQVDRA